jgi:tetratricopeptide (TPR) repeat protein
MQSLALSMHLGLARAYARLDDLTHAVEHFDRAITYQPERHRQGLMTRDTADLYRQAGDDEHAVERYLRALELLSREAHPVVYVDTIVALAYARLRQRGFSEAIATFEQALAVVKDLPKTDPALMASVLYDMATAHYTLGQYRGAATTYQRALQYLDPKKEPGRMVETLTALAHCYVELESFQQALESYHDALQIDGVSAAQRRAILAEQAEIFTRIGLVQSAIDAFRAALALEGAAPVELAALHRGLGTLYVQLNMAPKAQKHFESAVAAIQDEQSGPTLQSLGDVYRAQNKLQEAADAYHRAAAILSRADNPLELAATRRCLGEIYVQFGQIKEALYNLNQALDVERALPQQDGGRIVSTLYSLARAYEAGSDPDSAIRRYHEALVYQDARYTPEGYVETLRELGRLYMTQQRLDEAAKAYEEALGTEANLPAPDSEKVNSMTNALADVYRAQGRLEAAAKLYRQVMAVMQSQSDSLQPAPSNTSGGTGTTPQPLVKEVAAALELTETDINRHLQTLKAADQSWQLLNRGGTGDLKSLAFIRALQAQTSAALGRPGESEDYLERLIVLLKERRAELKVDDPRPPLRAMALLLQAVDADENGSEADADVAYRQAFETASSDPKANASLVWAIRQMGE